jgi:hypothetical protein
MGVRFLTFFGLICFEVSVGNDACGLAGLNGHNTDNGLERC